MLSSNKATIITNKYTIPKNIECKLPGNIFILNVHEEKYSFNIKYVPLNYRCCTNIEDKNLIYKQAKKLLIKLLKAFNLSKLNHIEVADINNTSLTTIISPAKTCFFKKSSIYLQKLISNSGFNHDQKLLILSELLILLNRVVLSDIQRNIAVNLIFSSINCLILAKNLNDQAIWQTATTDPNCVDTCIYNPQSVYQLAQNKNMAAQLKQYPLSIDLLCIEEERRFLDKKNDKVIDLGAHRFDNEWLYMERCYRAFLYLLNTQIGSFNYISFSDLRSVNAIIGGTISKAAGYGNISYGCCIPSSFSYGFMQLIKQGILSDANLAYGDVNISIEDRLATLKELFTKFFGIDIPLKVIDTNGRFYFTIEQDYNVDINSLDEDQQLLNDLQGKTANKAFRFKIFNFRDGKSGGIFSLRIEYIYNKKRADVCQQLLDIYYKKIKCFPEDTKKKVNLAVGLCILMQRIHPFVDGNGRTIFFILLPILLYQMNIWLTRMFKNPWLLIDLASPEEITERILPLCVPAPEFKNKISHYDSIKLEELIRISASLGDLKLIKSSLPTKINMFSEKIEISPTKRRFHMLEIAVIHDRPVLVDFILNNLPKRALPFTFLGTVVDTANMYDSKQSLEILCQYIKDKFNPTITKKLMAKVKSPT